jgi:hypothetical protein
MICPVCTLWFCDDAKCRSGLSTRERVARIYRADPAKKIAQVRQWQKDNKERLNAYQRARRIKAVRPESQRSAT